jgi:hypothetical protein
MKWIGACKDEGTSTIEIWSLDMGWKEERKLVVNEEIRHPLFQRKFIYNLRPYPSDGLSSAWRFNH